MTLRCAVDYKNGGYRRRLIPSVRRKETILRRICIKMSGNDRRQCLLLLKDRQLFSPVRKHVDAADYKIMSRFGGSKLLHYCTTSCVTERTRLHCTHETTGKRMYMCICDFLILQSGVQCLLRDSFFPYRHVRYQISQSSLV